MCLERRALSISHSILNHVVFFKRALVLDFLEVPADQLELHDQRNSLTDSITAVAASVVNSGEFS